MSEQIETAYTRKEEPFNAGKDIGRKLASSEPETVFLFSSVKYNFKRLIEGILSETATTITGCSSAGGICGGRIVENGAVAIGFNSPHIGFGSGVGTEISKDPFRAGADSVDNALADLRRKNLRKIFARYYASAINDPTQMIQKSPSFAAMSFIDGLSESEERILEGITNRFHSSVPLIGGSAGDDLRLQKTWQVCNNQVYGNSVVTTMLMTNSLLSFAVGHGWNAREKAVLVTKADGRKVYRINDRPAADVYAELLGVKTQDLIREKQVAFGTGLKHPLAIVSMTGECWLKHPKEVFEDGSISFFSEIPKGVALVTTDATPNSLIRTGIETAKRAIKPIGREKVDALFIFNCVARKAFLKDRAKEEVRQIAELTNAPIIGLYTYGEQAFTYSTPICHRNQLINIMAIGGK